MSIKSNFIIGTHKVGPIIKMIRSEKELTQEEFASSIGISRSYLCDLEHDRKSIGLEVFLRLLMGSGYTLLINGDGVTA